MAESTELMTVDNICNRVYYIRGQQVMLDYDLAELYGYEVKNLNRQVKRNIERFPDDFMFQLTKDECENLRCQNVTANRSAMSRTMPTLLPNKASICWQLFLEVSWQNSKVFLLCVRFVRCVII